MANHSSELMTQAILESISDGVFTVTPEWAISSFNRAAEMITGISRDEAIGMPCHEVFKSSMCESECPLRKTGQSGKPIINKSGYIINAIGERLPVSVSTALLKDEQGNVIGGAETFRDLREVETLRNALNNPVQIGRLISCSPAMQSLFKLLPNVSQSGSTVLLQGETGTGKELLAKSIHELSHRAQHPFVALNCGALPDELLESELFGYKKGAFTGATQDKPGRFALAGEGTLFLDEIGEISPALQVRLLRVLQEQTFEPLGATQTEKSQARVIAATHRDLNQMVAEGKFRQDLYYRIKVIDLNLPPLRQRPEDLELLTNQFIHHFNQLQNRQISQISPETLTAFKQYLWPGNVRELENIIERAFVHCSEELIKPEHLPSELLINNGFSEQSMGIKESRQEAEKERILRALERNNFNRLATAKELGIHKTTLYRKMKALRIES